METETVDSSHIYKGSIPLVYKVHNNNEELLFLVNFLSRAARETHLPLGSCAVLCPTEQTGMTIAEGLCKLGINAFFMKRQAIDLNFSGVKVLTIHSSKGLEFPIVALAGFNTSRYAQVAADVQDEGRKEILERDRRTLFVGMTRAMFKLLMIAPVESQSPLLTGFDTTYWKLED